MRTLNEQEKQRVKFVISDMLSVDEDLIHNQSHLKDDLGADSLDELEICMEVEKEFDISIPDSLMEQVKTVQDLYDTVEKVLNKEL